MIQSCQPVLRRFAIFLLMFLFIIKSIVNGFTCASIGYIQLWTCGTCSSSTQFTTYSGDSRFGGTYTGCTSECFSSYGDNTNGGIITQITSTDGYTGIAVVYEANPNTVSSSTPCYVQVSYNGGSSWSTVGTHSGTAHITDQVAYLSSFADDNPNFQLRWLINSAASSGQFCNFDTSSICALYVCTN